MSRYDSCKLLKWTNWRKRLEIKMKIPISDSRGSCLCFTSPPINGVGPAFRLYPHLYFLFVLYDDSGILPSKKSSPVALFTPVYLVSPLQSSQHPGLNCLLIMQEKCLRAGNSAYSSLLSQRPAPLLARGSYSIELRE